MSEWKEVQLSNICLFQEGYVNPTQKNPSYFDGRIKWLRAVDLNNSYVFNTTRTLTEEGFNSAGKSALLFKPNTIGISKSGTIGRVGILKDYMCGNRAVINIDIQKGKADLEFIYYWLLTNNAEIQNRAIGSVQKNLYISNLESMWLKLPYVEEQKEIALTLSNLDQKITLLRQQNETLEELEQILFKRWFVEFEFPNENGEPYLSAGGKLVESELGEIPEGWSVAHLEDVVEIGSSKRIFASEYLEEGIPFYRGKEITKLSNGINLVPEIYISKERYGELKQISGAPKENDILLTSVGTIGNTYLVEKGEDFYFKDGNLTWFKAYKTYIDSTFIFTWLNSKHAEIAIESIKIGSTQQAITITSLNTIEIVIPSEEAYLKFKDSLKSTISKRQTNSKEIQTLTQLRDTLLPKLMSGELRVKDINA